MNRIVVTAKYLGCIVLVVALLGNYVMWFFDKNHPEIVLCGAFGGMFVYVIGMLLEFFVPRKKKHASEKSV